MKISQISSSLKVRHFVFTVPLLVTSATELTVIIIQFLVIKIYSSKIIVLGAFILFNSYKSPRLLNSATCIENQ